MKIFGVTGYPSSGKDTVSNHLVSLGFSHISTGDFIRDEMKRLAMPTDRTSIQEFVHQARKERGSGYLAEEAIKKVTSNSVISGLRNAKEVVILREKFGKDFVLIAVEAPLESRYKWALSRKREGDQISFERFKTEDEVERVGNKDSIQIDSVVQLADVLILNDGTKEELLQKVDDFLLTIK